MAKTKKASLFWRAYVIIGIVLVAAVAVWLIFLYSWLADFEASQPKYLAEETFEKHFEDFDAKEYVKLCGITDGIETEENIVAYLKSCTDGKDLVYKKVSSGMDDGIKYSVYAGEEELKIASFVLREEKSGDSPFKTYKAEDFQIYTSAKGRVSIEAPEGYNVYVNGIALGEEYISEKDIKTDSCSYMPEGVSGLIYTKYTVTGLLSFPTVEVSTSDGTVATLEGGENSYKALPVYDEALKEKYGEWVLEGIEKYAKYSQYDSNVNTTGFNQVAPYFDPESQLYESIRTMDNMFVIHYDKFEFTDMSADEFYSYDENTFSCRVRYTQKLYKGNDVYDDFADQTLYLRRVDGEFLIYEMKVN